MIVSLSGPGSRKRQEGPTARPQTTKRFSPCLRRRRLFSPFPARAPVSRLWLLRANNSPPASFPLTVPEARVSHDEELHWIQAAQAGDTRAYAALVDRYWPRIQRWLQGLTSDPQEAEDLTQ